MPNLFFSFNFTGTHGFLLIYDPFYEIGTNCWRFKGLRGIVYAVARTGFACSDSNLMETKVMQRCLQSITCYFTNLAP